MALFNVSGLTSSLMGWFRTGTFWLVFLIIVACIIFGFLVIRRQRRLDTKVVVITEIGNDKIEFNLTKAGLFKMNLHLGGLIDTGKEKCWYTSGKNRIMDVSSQDFHFLVNKKCLVVARKHDDPKILVPISKIYLDNASRRMLYSIAPADYRDYAGQLYREAKKETASKNDKVVQALMWAGFFIFALIVIIFIIQFGGRVFEKSEETLKYIADKLVELNQAKSATPSPAP